MPATLGCGMGLRLVAVFYDRSEAMVAAGALDASGIPTFVQNYWHNSVRPFGEIALGGYRMMVCEEDLAGALAVIEEARAKRSFEGERLTTHALIEVSLLLFVLSGVLIPFRWHRWRDAD